MHDDLKSKLTEKVIAHGFPCEVELVDLVGEHVLTGVDFGKTKVMRYTDEYEDANTMRFVLDGVTVMAIEDPSDGYRSSMKSLVVTQEEVTNPFPPVRVLARHITARYRRYGTDRCDILELIDLVTGQTVAECGTDNADDYYPSFVASFHPEAMATNREKLTP